MQSSISINKESGSAYIYPCHIRSRVAHTHVCHIRSGLQVLIWNFYLMVCNTTLNSLHYAELVRVDIIHVTYLACGFFV